MADLAPVYDALKKADAAGDSAGAKRLADYIRSSSAATPKENLPDAAMQRNKEIGEANLAASHEELPGFSQLRDMITSIPKGMNTAASGMVDAASHPLDAIGTLYNKGLSAIDTGINAVGHPIDTTKKVGEMLKNTKPQQVGELIGSTAMGGAAGKAAGVLGDVAGPTVKEALARAGIGKPVSPTVKALADKGVVTTPGQRGGKIPSAIEQRLTSIPIVGDAIKAARARSAEQWNRSELNDAIKDAGGKPLPKDRQGRDAIFHAESEIGKAYDRVLSKMKADLNSADSSGTSFRQFLDQTKTLANQGLEPGSAKIVNDIIDKKVIGKFTKDGSANGENIKEIQEALRTEIADLKSGNYQERKVSQALQQVSAEMKAMLKRENPVLAPELDKVDRGYAKFKTSSQASLYSTKGAGGYTPAQKLRAIKARDASKGKQRFASGAAPGQKEAESVESVIGNTEPDSGTPGRLAVMDGLLKAIVSAPASAAYSKPVLKFLQNRALKKGGAYTPIGKSAPLAGAALTASPGVDEMGVQQ
jgi:hypothetical protein